jgi:hypothetical protein
MVTKVEASRKQTETDERFCMEFCTAFHLRGGERCGSERARERSHQSSPRGSRRKVERAWVLVYLVESREPVGRTALKESRLAASAGE